MFFETYEHPPIYTWTTLFPLLCQRAFSLARWPTIISSNSIEACESSNTGGAPHTEHVQLKPYLRDAATHKYQYVRTTPLLQDISSSLSVGLCLAWHSIAVRELLSSGDLSGGNGCHPPPVKVHPGKVGQAGVVEQGEGGEEGRPKGLHLSNDFARFSLLYQHLAQPMVVAG